MNAASKATRNRTVEELITQALPAIHAMARQVKQSLPRWYLLEDLIAAGMQGAWRAAQRYDPTRLGRPLETKHSFVNYAKRRIRGAMADWLRDEDPYTRHERTKIKNGELQERRTLTNWEDNPSVSFRNPSSSWDDYRHARLAITPQDRVILALYCIENYTLAEIGDVFGVSHSRICQRIKQAKTIINLQQQRELHDPTAN